MPKPDHMPFQRTFTRIQLDCVRNREQPTQQVKSMFFHCVGTEGAEGTRFPASVDVTGVVNGGGQTRVGRLHRSGLLRQLT